LYGLLNHGGCQAPRVRDLELCTVGHDTGIGMYSFLMPSVNVSGEVEIGESVYVGTRAKIINRLSIGKEVSLEPELLLLDRYQLVVRQWEFQRNR